MSYKYSLANAQQRTYIQTNFETVTTFATTVFQIIAIVVFRNYMAYLLAGLAVNVVMKITANAYLNKRYPILTEPNEEKLDEEEKTRIKKDVKGLIFHRLGEISVYQTDNIIISAFISLELVGKISNYTMIIDGISKFTNATFNSFIASFGNLIALEDDRKQHRIFKEYKFIGFWVYGFCAIMLYIFLSPFIGWVWQDSLTIDELSVALICLDFYFRGHRICINNIKTAGGIFYQDRYVAFLQAILNLVLSIFFASRIGLPGVYVGTVIQGIAANIIKPYYVYRDIFHEKTGGYYRQSIGYFLIFMLTAVICRLLKAYFLIRLTFLNLVGFGIMMIIVINGLFLLFNFRREEFISIVGKIRTKLG
jgi:O-antigen/teichoic acid export membrane protein